MKNKINENRPLAFIVLAVVIVLSIALSGGGGLRSLRADVMQVFRTGVNGDGLCVYTDLQERADCAYNLAALALRYNEIPQDIGQKAEAAANEIVNVKNDDTSAMKRANDALGRTVEALYTELENADLSETDATYALSQYKEFTSRGLTISRDGYNSLAEEFNRTIGVFPANLVAMVSGVGQLTLFR